MDIPHRSVFGAFGRLERQLGEFLDYVPFEQAHHEVWSPILATIILEACSQLDSLWKMELREIGGTNADAKIPDYFK